MECPITVTPLEDCVPRAAAQLVEISIVYIDIGLYGLTVLLWAGVFIVEEVRAVRKILGGR